MKEVKKALSNSSLVCYTKISPNRTSPRNHAIDTISIHCMAGQLSIESCGGLFASPSRCASSNYGIGPDGRIAMYVEEKDRSWCTSNSANDNRAVTIEVASNPTHPYAVTDAAYKSLIELLVDICKRNGIKKLLWQGNPALIGQVDKQNMTAHRWFKSKACPGDFLYNKHKEIASLVNKKLGAGSHDIQGTTISTAPPASKSNYRVKIIADILNIRTGPGTKYAQVSTTKKGTKHTVVAESNGWGQLKSGRGWISLDSKYVSKIEGKEAEDTKIDTSKLPSFKKGQSYTLKDEMKIRTGPGTNFAVKKHYQLTESGQASDKDKDGALDKGSKVTCQGVKIVSQDEVWMRCPSGWIAAYYNGKTFVK